MDPSMGWALSWWIAWFLSLFGMEVERESKQRSGSNPGVTRQPGGKPRQPKSSRWSETGGLISPTSGRTGLVRKPAILD
jgi:hypothetical protein